MRRKLTKSIVESLGPASKDVVRGDTELPGFGVRVKPAGIRRYIVQYRERLHVVAPDGWRAWRQGDEPPPPCKLRLCIADPVEDALASGQDAACLARGSG
jgi:hypothetical protein